MPLYEYECVAGHRFEVIQKFSDAPIELCRVCGEPVHKLQSAPAFHLKGTGWYATDYAKSGATPGGKDGNKDSKDSKDSKDDKKADGESKTSDKPAASTDSAPAAATPAAAKPDTPKS